MLMRIGYNPATDNTEIATISTFCFCADLLIYHINTLYRGGGQEAGEVVLTWMVIT